MRTFILAISFFLIFGISSAQENFITRHSFLSAGYMQAKESANFGLVFKGPGLNYGMCWNFVNDNRLITYEFEIGAGILFSRDIPALGFYLKPVDLAYMFKIPAGESNLHIGPSLKLEYNYNLYPDLQSGFDYWFTTAGIALEEKLIKSINDPISDYLTETEEFQDKKDIQIEQLLTMKSGISYSNDGLEGQTDDILRKLPDKITRFILGLPLADEPGEQARYKDCDPQLVSAVIQSQCGKSTSAWAKEMLFDKLEIKNLEWRNYKDGVTLGGFGILTTPREMAKFGQCVLDSGLWKGTTVVPKEWIRQMTTIRVQDI
jgi:hypothetical protein